MQLLKEPEVRRRLNDIKSEFELQAPAGPEATCHDKLPGIDRFFWLRAEKNESGNGGHRIRSIFSEPPPDVEGTYRLCNLILQGGGALGLAHAGFVAGLEAAGIRFAGLAGTSAGSIIAMGIAAIRGRDLTHATAERLAALTETVPMDHFIDGPRPIRKFIKQALKQPKIYQFRSWFGLFAAVRRLRDSRGLNPGRAFEYWMQSVLDDLGFKSIEDMYLALDQIWNDLEDLREEKLELKGQGEKELAILKPTTAGLEHPGIELLQLIATAMPVGLKMHFPKDLNLLSDEYSKISPARLVRTSMSIPAFFDPVVMRPDRKTWPAFAEDTLRGLFSEDQIQRFKELEKFVFLDGGLTSNLPSDSFRKLMPDVPTVVVPLVSSGEKQNVSQRRRLSDLVGDAIACATAVRLQRDREIWIQNAALRAQFENRQDPKVDADFAMRKYPVGIAPIDPGKANWLNFVMSGPEKTELYLAGLKRAEAFLKELNKTE
ncbi:patatin-like phospholipase family protein [Ruegeria marisrubri]|uniref:patatin-like phospholipase family protein n=1 Tax=Ruegeria marisrubri TaxID=1685379 RepID=UPI001CD75E46|nr:patatin-like phospholipase family protein [Ruegeria marisrubri]MCA0905465.1 patatin-like phospholipase family protein [Ruegeria marisrubri]